MIKDIEYVVKKSDNLWGITKKSYGTTTVQLCGSVAALNGIEFPNLIYPGQRLRLPATIAIAENPPGASNASSGGQCAKSATETIEQCETCPLKRLT